MFRGCCSVVQYVSAVHGVCQPYLRQTFLKSPFLPTMASGRAHRAMTQRLMVVSMPDTSAADLSFQVLGSSETTYLVSFNSEVPSCTCPDHTYRRSRCKHIIFVLRRVLDAEAEVAERPKFARDEIVALLAAVGTRSSHAQATAPPSAGVVSPGGVHQKPLDADPCPVCYEAIEGHESVLYCKASCGSNVHRDCYLRWHHHDPTRDHYECVMCRAQWKASDV